MDSCPHHVNHKNYKEQPLKIVVELVLDKKDQTCVSFSSSLSPLCSYILARLRAYRTFSQYSRSWLSHSKALMSLQPALASLSMTSRA